MIYRFAVSGSAQESASLRAAINHYTAGVLRIDASRDGQSWVAVAEFDGQKRGGRADLPKSLLPADHVFVRLSQSGQEGGFQVDTFEYEAALRNPPPDAEGQTLFLESREASSDIGIALAGLTCRAADGGFRVEIVATNRASRST